MQTKIMIVEDEVLIAEGIKEVLLSYNYDVVGICQKEVDIYSCIGQYRPDLILMDINLNLEVDGVELAAIIKQLYNAPIVFLTAFSDDATINRAKSVLPYGYVVKPVNEKALHATIQTTLVKFNDDQKMKIYLSPDNERNNKDEKLIRTSKGKLQKLTKKEIEVLAQIKFGHTNKDIAQKLGVSELTIKTHRRNLMKKLQLHTSAQLVYFANNCDFPQQNALA